MTNYGPSRYAESWAEAAEVLRDPVFRAGYRQAYQGQRLNHDHLSRHGDQLLFENGRHLYAWMLHLNIKPPSWASMSSIPHVIQCVVMDVIRGDQRLSA